jgi:hypothetical protein
MGISATPNAIQNLLSLPFASPVEEQKAFPKLS